MNKIDDLCLWKDLFYLYDAGYKNTTFDGYKHWRKDHPLYKCTTPECDGFDTDCVGYKSLKSINRNRKK